MDDDFRRSLAFVAPERRLIVEQRLAALRRYDELSNPRSSDAAAAAEQLGLTRQGFEWVLAAWRRRRDPAVLEGVPGNAPPRDADRGDEDFIRRTFATLPSGRALERDAQDIRREAERMGIELRGAGSMRRLLTLLRAQREAASAPSRVVIDHVVLEMPVEAEDRADPVMPIATVVADVQRRALLRVALDLYTPTAASVAALIAQAAADGAFVRSATNTSIGMDTGREDSWLRLEHALAASGVSVAGAGHSGIRGGSRAGGLVVPRLLGIATRPGIVNKHIQLRRAKLRKKGDAALPLDKARSIIEERLAFEPERTPVPFSTDPAALIRLTG